MGKKKRRMFSPKFAAYRKRMAMANREEKEPTPVVEEKPQPVDKEEPSGMEILTTKDLMEESKSDVIVVKNKKKEEKPSKQDRQPAPEPQLQEVEVSEPPKKKPNGLKRAQTSRTSTRRKTTKTKKD